MNLSAFSIEKYHGLEVAWSPHLDGGGRGYGQNYISVVKSLLGKVNRIYEFCAGPGFIGFSLLAEGLCDSLCLSDINPEAIAALNETVRRNGLQDKVSVYLSDGLDDIPSTEKWDLVVSNPPHFQADTQKDILRHDPNWDIHKKFFLNIHRFLKPHGNILLQESYQGSEENDFLQMLEPGGLQYMGSFMHKKSQNQFRDIYYFLWLKNKHPELIWQDSPIQTLRVSLSSMNGGRFSEKLRAWQKYRFEIFNDLGDAANVSLVTRNAAFGPNDIVVFSIPKITSNTRSKSNIFYLTPGRFDLVDSAKGKRFSTIECE